MTLDADGLIHMSGLAEESISVEEAKELVKAPSGKIRLVITDNDPSGV